ncbi:MAG: TolC family outer membrane protein [Polaromonas sp.]|nr:TolC family outer membrane protein [Polaromonas sp.]
MVEKSVIPTVSLLPLARAGACAMALVCAPAWPLDLSQAYQAALAQDATIRSVRAATDARRERLPQARAQLLPNLSASASRYRNALERTSPDFFGRLVTSDERYTSSSETLTLRQPLFRKLLMADYRQAQAQVDDANAILERELQNVAVRVSGAYFEALLAEEQLALVLAQKTAYTTQLDAAEKRFRGGAGTRTDIDEARGALDLNVAQELEARQSLDLTHRQLQSLINRPVDRLAPLDARRMQLLEPAPDRVEDWTERAETHSPEVQSLRAQVEVARQDVDKAQAGHYPTLDAIVQWSRSDSDTVTTVKNRYNNRSIGVQLNVPIFSGGYVSSTVRQAVAAQLRAEEALEALRRDLGVRLHREFRGVTEGVLRVKALEQAVRSAEQVVISNRRSFEAGSRTLPDLLNAEQQKVSAQRDLAQARLIYLISRVRLHALSGGPKAEVIDEVNGWLTR